MITPLFSNHFFSLITPPNKEKIIEGVKNLRIDKISTSQIEWNKYCSVEVEELYANEIAPLFTPSVRVFLEQIGSASDIEFVSIWRNTYKKGGYQEVHHHMYGKENADISACLFFDDFHLDAGKFYFYNRNASEISERWRELFSSTSYTLTPKAYDIIFFPSYMLHGVTVHRLKKPRRTLSFNMRFK